MMSARSSAVGTWKSMSVSAISESGSVSHLSSDVSSEVMWADCTAVEYLELEILPLCLP